MKKEDWDAVIATNLTGAFLAIQQVSARHDEASAGAGSSIFHRWSREAGNPGQTNYVASKAGLIGLTKSLAQEMA